MSSKLGTILSMFFVFIFVCMGLDLICIQFIYSDLDAKSTSIAYIISKNRIVSDNLVTAIEERYNIKFTCLGDCYADEDNIIDFAISTTYQPFFISKERMTITVKRQAIIGYYG